MTKLRRVPTLSLAVHNKKGEIVIDTGDMMARLTNNRIPATMHRVINPKDTSRARYSIPFFVHPKNDVELISDPKFGEAKFPPINAGDFLKERLKENGFICETKTETANNTQIRDET